MVHFVENGVSHPVGGVCLADTLQEHVGVAGACKPRRAIGTYLHVGEQVRALARGDLIVNVA
jgi:hypothetical protein